MADKKLPKLVVILGVTSSGKTDLGIALAKKFKGEVVSADSRQVYREFDIGTAKPAGHWLLSGSERKFVAGGVAHHLVDTFDPKEDFTLADFKASALEKIKSIHKKGLQPFLVGGTALYIKAVCENWDIPRVEPNQALRRRLENKKIEDLFEELKKNDPEAAAVTGPKNKRRIVRALEVIYGTGRKFSEQRKTGRPLFNVLKIGLKVEKTELEKRLAARTASMIKNGLVQEVERLQKKYPWSLPPMQSIDYQEFKDYFEGKSGLTETVKLINRHHLAYARHQLAWFKKDKAVQWVPAEPKTALAQAETLVRKFLSH